jgi:hypothetical protein
MLKTLFALAGIGILFAQAAIAATDLPVSFAKDIVPTLKTQCAICHLSGEEAGNLALHPKGAYASLVGKTSTESSFQIVHPGKPEESYLIMKLEGIHLDKGGSGEQMPFAAPPLAPELIAKIKLWIAQGAQNN